MKHLIIMAFMLVSLVSQAQTFVPVTHTSKVAGKETIHIENKDFNVTVMTTGAIKLERTSKSGNKYYQYLGYKYDATTMVDGKEYQVYSDKSQSKFWYLTLSKSGNPVKRELIKQ